MKSIDENYMSMVRNVISVLDRYADIWKKVKKYTDYVTTLIALTSDTQEHQILAELDPKGYTENKHLAEALAIELALDLSKRASSYAWDSKQMDLYEQLNITKHDLLQGHDSQIVAKLKDILASLKKNTAALQDYGIDAEDLGDLKKATDTYNSLLDKPREKIVERKGYNTTIAKNMPAIKEVIEQMDNLMGNFKETPFAVDYKNARIVIDTGRSGGNDEGEDKPTPPSNGDGK